MEAVTGKVIGTAFGIGSSLSRGSAEKAAAKAEAKQMVANAKARYARGTREAGEQRRMTNKMISDARAAQAGSGGTTTDPGAINQQAKIADVGEYNALSAIFDAETESDSMRYGAKLRKREGKMASRAGYAGALSQASTLIPASFKLSDVF